jgi:hypothetical protein
MINNYSPAGSTTITGEDLRLEAVTVSVGFDDLLDITLRMNMVHLDTMIVVTTAEDRKTRMVARKYGALCIQTDLFTKNGRKFNKGAAINAGFGYFQYRGWRLHLDSDIALPDNFRRVLFNHTSLDKDKLYGADRVNVVGKAAIDSIRYNRVSPQFHNSFLVDTAQSHNMGSRFVSMLHGYLPLGYFQMWNARTQQPYPYSLGSAAHDDILFSALYAESQRALLPTTLVYHLCPKASKMGENWDGNRKMARYEDL